ncbi:hypothetical protein [Aminipila terrae]|uniref:Uncharacterized protein n=1 Tax=Aminipila terrae TaxID=2697030 RepID=A0A6P1MR50_9FIRM|nr:hypothetical protein [Aminipila terrae]QHI73475.1 hypothetical protein Ami3637_14795 [Aminipila terrae]
MNFLDSHKIVSDYVDAFARGVEENAMIFRPISYLNGMAKDDIINAYKIFYAHTILYGSRNNEQIQQYDNLLRMINSFVNDEVYYDVARCIKRNTNIFTGKLKKNISNELKQYCKSSTEVLNVPDEVNEVFIFYNDMIEVLNQLYEFEDAGKIDRPNLVIQYFKIAYEYANIEYKEDEYIPFFYSFDLMRKHIDDPYLGKYYTPYRDYILEND